MKPGAFVLLVLLAGCAGRPNAASLLPTADASGWKVASQPRSFAPDALWEYLDGGAERYLRAGVQQTVTAEYRFHSGLEASADVHVFPTTGAAAEILAGEPVEGSRPAGIGDDGRLYPGALVFRTGRCIVRLTAFQSAPGADGSLAALGQTIDMRIKKAGR